MSDHRDSEGRELQKHTLFLFAGDYAELNTLFPQAKAAKVIRHLVRDLIKRTRGGTVDVTVDIGE